MDITKDGMQPIRDNSSHNSIFFVLFMFVGAFFMLKIFVGIIVGTFRQFSGTALLTDSQIRWLATKRMMQGIRLKKKKPDQCVRRAAHDITTNSWFEGFITSCILFHILTLATQSPAQHNDQTLALIIIHWVVTGIYTLELVMRIIAKSPFAFFYKSEEYFWNNFDILIVAFMYIMPLGIGTFQGIGVARALQFGRVTKLMRYFRGINHLFAVLSMSIPAMLNVVVLFLLMMFVFSILGMQLFASVRTGPWLDELSGFSTFPQAILTLFQIVAGENWIPIMRDCSVEAPSCSPYVDGGEVASHWHDTGDCGTSAGAGFFFFGFFVMVFCELLFLFFTILLFIFFDIFFSFSFFPFFIFQFFIFFFIISLLSLPPPISISF